MRGWGYPRGYLIGPDFGQRVVGAVGPPRGDVDSGLLGRGQVDQRDADNVRHAAHRRAQQLGAFSLAGVHLVCEAVSHQNYDSALIQRIYDTASDRPLMKVATLK